VDGTGIAVVLIQVAVLGLVFECSKPAHPELSFTAVSCFVRIADNWFAASSAIPLFGGCRPGSPVDLRIYNSCGFEGKVVMPDARVKGGDIGPIGSNPAIESSYQCSKCGQSFPADKVWNANGQIICKSCFAKISGKSAANANDKAAVKESSPKIRTARRSRPPSLLPKVTCPHCWHRFPPEQILWVSQHSELLGDLVLGPDAASRFLPTRFSTDGSALDRRRSTSLERRRVS
jgi:DNA-directed RNA polymerase subunit RPC12/RpoP